jgi:SH3-like domain-containing protein
MNFTRIAAAAAVLMALSASYAQALPALAVNDVKVRQGPGANYRIVGMIPGGSTVEVTGCRGHWCAIEWQGHSGYATVASFVRSDGPPPAAEGPPPMSPPGAYPPGYVPPPVADFRGFEFGPYSAHYYGPYSSGYSHYWPSRWWWPE